MKRRIPAGLGGSDLRRAMQRVTEQYEAFMAYGPEAGTDDDTAAFARHHTACRTALAHLEQLIRVARAMGGEPPEAIEEATAMLTEARDAIARYEEEDSDGAGEQC